MSRRGRMLAAVAPIALAAACGGGDGWQQEDGYRWRTLAVPESGEPGFTLLTPEESGVAFTNTVTLAAALAQRNLFNGAGVAAGDVSGDGLPDIYLAGTALPGALYLNQGDMRFRAMPDAPTVAAGHAGTGAAFADTDGDADLDLLLTGDADARLFENDGHGGFTDVSAASGISSTSGSTSMALADIDRDRDLDLYITNYRTQTLRDAGAVRLQRVEGQYQIPPGMEDRLVFDKDGRLLELGEPDFLLINDGRGAFRLASWTDGRFQDEAGASLSKPVLDWGLAVGFHDLNTDGLSDLYVVNDFESPDRVWINQGAGRFRAAPGHAVRTTSATSMAVDFADIDLDGDVDLFVDDMLSADWQRRRAQIFAIEPQRLPPGDVQHAVQVPRNTLQLARGDGTYAEAAQMAGVDATDWSWGAVFLDVDLDGLEDLLVVNGHPYDMQNADANARQARIEGTEAQRTAVLTYPDLDAPNVALRNRGDLTFERRSKEWGFDTVGVTHGLALADLDRDGDLDAVTNNLDMPAGVYRNDSAAARVAVRLEGVAPNTRGIGAKVRLLGGAVDSQSKEMIAGGRYLSGSEPVVVFAAGDGTGMTIEVDWPSGAGSRIEAVEANREYVLVEPGSAPPPTPPPTQVPALFEDMSDAIAHVHTEDAYDDFADQPLLPRRLSVGGPGVAWMDVNADGAMDLIVGTGKGGRVAVMMGDGQGGFRNSDTGQSPSPGDTTGLGAVGVEKGRALAFGIAGFGLEQPGSENAESNPESGSAAVAGAVAFVDADGDPLILRSPASPGPLAFADVEGDGDLDLFVGARALPGRWPDPGLSMLLRRDQTGWSTETIAAGLVSGAVWTDLTGDGLPELVLAREWSPPGIYANVAGQLRDATVEWGVDRLSGWWNGVDAGDVNGDGLMDLVLTNWGTNTPYTATPDRPAVIYHGTLEADGRVVIVEAARDPDRGMLVPLRGIADLGRVLPGLGSRITSFAQYASTSLQDLLGSDLDVMARLEATTFEHSLLLNRGGTFEARALPAESQLAPAFGVTVADFDGDGDEDVFVAQNYSGQRPGQEAANAGRGVLLRGDGSGGLDGSSDVPSGIAIYGDGRGSASADFDKDGRLDLAVGQNGGRTVLLRNRGAQPALRVRLAGPEGNPDGVGALVRGDRSRGAGPVFELRSGSGYWSLNAPEVLLARGLYDAQVDVRWPVRISFVAEATPGLGAAAVGAPSTAEAGAAMKPELGFAADANAAGWTTYDIPQGATEVVLYPDGAIDVAGTAGAGSR